MTPTINHCNYVIQKHNYKLKYNHCTQLNCSINLQKLIAIYNCYNDWHNNWHNYWHTTTYIDANSSSLKPESSPSFSSSSSSPSPSSLYVVWHFLNKFWISNEISPPISDCWRYFDRTQILLSIVYQLFINYSSINN